MGCKLSPSSVDLAETFSRMTVAAVAGTSSSAFSFDAPVGSFLSLINVALTTGMSVTVRGLGFGSYDLTQTVMLNLAPCGTLSWHSLTLLACLATEVSPVASQVVTVSALTGTGAAVLSFDAPFGSSTALNSVASGESSVTVTGLSLIHI